MEKEKNFDDINLEEIVNSAIERMKSSDVYLLTNLDLDLIKRFLKRVLRKLISCEPEKLKIDFFRRCGLRAYRMGVPDILILYIYNSLKEVLEKLQNKERMKIIDRGFKEFFKPYIFDYYHKETDTSFIVDASFDLIKTLEKAKESHLSCVNSFFRAVTSDEEFKLPLAMESCPFSSYIEKMEMLKENDLYLSILKYYEEFRKAVSYALAMKDKGFEEYYKAIKEVDRISIKILDALNSLLIDSLSKITVYDPLTRLFNRNYLLYALEKELQRSKRYGFEVSLLMLDIDNFKLINDTYGHTVGDEVLKHVAKIIKKSIRATDILIRYGGEEFLIILPYTPLNYAKQIAERIRFSIKENPVKLEDLDIQVTVSVGVAKAEDFEDIIKNVDRVDKAMYIAKRTGKDRVFVLEDG